MTISQQKSICQHKFDFYHLPTFKVRGKTHHCGYLLNGKVSFHFNRQFDMKKIKTNTCILI